MLAVLLALAFLLVEAATPVHGSAQANSLGDMWGVVTDPLKLGRASGNMLASVERIQLLLHQLGNIEETTNRDLTDRLNQAKAVVDDVVRAVDRNIASLEEVVANAERQLSLLEGQIYIDAQSILDQMECVTKDIATVEIQQAIANAVGTLKEADPSLTFLGVRIINLRLRQVVITDPDKAYISVRDVYLRNLDALEESSSAYIIVSTYANIARLARTASCAFRDPTEAKLFLEEQFTYRRLTAAWIGIPLSMQINP